MEDIRLALRALLLGDATVSALVGGVRIHPIRLPQGQKAPSIVYSRISEGVDYHMQGDSGLAEARMQIDSLAQTEWQSVELANAVYDRLSGHIGAVVFGTNFPQDEIFINAIFMDTGRENFDVSSQLFRMSCDYIIRYRSRRRTSIGFNLVTDFGGVGDGVFDNSQAFKDFRTTARLITDLVVELLIPPGSYDILPLGGFNGLVFDGIRRLIVNAHGASIIKPIPLTTFAGFVGFSADFNARVDTVLAGATTATCKIPSQAGRFQPSRYCALAALDWQGHQGQPPNHQYIQYVRILSNDPSTGVVEFTPAATQEYADNYRDNYPGGGGIVDPGGPATLFLMKGYPNDGDELAWDTDVTFNGLTIDNSAAAFQQCGCAGRRVVLNDCTFLNSIPLPSSNEFFQANDCFINSNIEFDKECVRVEFNNCNIEGVQVQSSSIQTLVFDGTTVNTFFFGTARNTIIRNSTLDQFRIGVTGFGCAETLVIQDSIVAGPIDTNLSDTRHVETNFDNNAGELTYTGVVDSGLMTWGAPGALLFQGGFFTQNAGSPTDLLDVRANGLNQAVLDTNFADPFVVKPPDVGNLTIVQHPCRDVTVTNCTGCPEIVEMSMAPDNLPLYSYSYRTGSFFGGETSSPLWGKHISVRINVITPYTGVAATCILRVRGGRMIAADGLSDYQFDAFVNCKIAGQRLITATTVTGAQSGDTLGAAPGDAWWTSAIVSHTTPDSSGESIGLHPVIEVEAFTDQLP